MSDCILTSRGAVELDPMDVGEVDDVLFEFEAGMRPSDVISAAAVVVEMVEGDDSSPEALAVGLPAVGVLDPVSGEFSASASGRIVAQRLTAAGRTNAATYCVRCTANLASGRQLVIVAHIGVERL